ncbi:MAG: hypothetical protein ACYCUG_01915 [Acidimicrobiales bacterium]
MSPDVVALLGWLDQLDSPATEAQLGAQLDLSADALSSALDEATAAGAVARFNPSATTPGSPVTTLASPYWMITPYGQALIRGL